MMRAQTNPLPRATDRQVLLTAQRFKTCQKSDVFILVSKLLLSLVSLFFLSLQDTEEDPFLRSFMLYKKHSSTSKN